MRVSRARVAQAQAFLADYEAMKAQPGARVHASRQEWLQLKFSCTPKAAAALLRAVEAAEAGARQDTSP